MQEGMTMRAAAKKIGKENHISKKELDSWSDNLRRSYTRDKKKQDSTPVRHGNFVASKEKELAFVGVLNTFSAWGSSLSREQVMDAAKTYFQRPTISMVWYAINSYVIWFDL